MKSVFKVKAIAVLSAVLFICLFTACPNTANDVEQALAGVVPGGSAPSNPPLPPAQDDSPKAQKVEGGVSLLVAPGCRKIKIRTVTSDNSKVTVTGCDKDFFISDFNTPVDLSVKTDNTQIVLKGKIVELYCDNNEITSLNVQGLHSLKKLSCGLNELTSLNVQGLTSLQCLECHSNKLTSLDVSGLSALKEVLCNANKISLLRTNGCDSLQKLDCDSNQLAQLNVQGLKALRHLSVGNNLLTELDVHGLTSLKEVQCACNRLTKLNVKGALSLRQCECYCNGLDAQAFENIFNDLPQCGTKEKDTAQCILYSKNADYPDRNFADFTSASDSASAVKAAFKDAKTNKHWKMCKYTADGKHTEI